MKGVPVVQQQQQLSIEIFTTLSIKTVFNIYTRCYRKSAILKQKARSRSRYVHIAIIYKLFIQTIAWGIRYEYRYFGSNVHRDTNSQAVGIDETLENLGIKLSVGIDRYP